MRKSFLFVLLAVLFIQGFASEQLVPVTKKSIKWKENIDLNDVILVNSSSKYKCRDYLNIDKLKNGNLRAKHYIFAQKPICNDDVYTQAQNKLKFNFGLLEIERNGELIRETDKYIKIKNPDGTIEKIYKNGQNK